MRFNCHAHIFNFRAVFTDATRDILLNRLTHQRWPDYAVKAAEEVLQRLLTGENLDEEKLLRIIVDKTKAAAVLDAGLKAALARLPDGIQVSLTGDIAGLPVAALRELFGALNGALQAGDAADDVAKAEFSDLLAFLALGIKPSVQAVAAELLERSGPDTACVALMMDITRGGGADEALFAGQIRDTSLAALRFPGRLLPFVAVNTLRKTHFTHMENALEEQGFVGVKLYPSLGYTVDSELMREVYEYCEAHGTPVLLHCNHGGFFRTEADISLCDPKHWRPILKSYPRLRVCFGHFGGDEELCSPAIGPDSWTGSIIALMREFEGVYADISYHEGPMNGGAARDNYFANLGALLADPLLGRRLLFGSDFLLVRQRVREDRLWDFFARNFKPADFDRITQDNPRAYLGLPDEQGQGAAENITRHLDFLVRHRYHVGEMPAAWVLKALEARPPLVKFFPNPFGVGWSTDSKAHRFTYAYFLRLMSKDDAGTVTFRQAGAIELRLLPGWTLDSADGRDTEAKLFALTGSLINFLEASPEPAAKLAPGVTAPAAHAAFAALFKNPDTRIADFGPVVAKLFQFPS